MSDTPHRSATAGAVSQGPFSRRGRGSLSRRLSAPAARRGGDPPRPDARPGAGPRRAAPVDAPPFDRATVDGFAVRSADIFDASGAETVCLRLNPEIIACGVVLALPIRPATATPIATGDPIPHGADAVAPGTHVSFAGSDIARGQTLLRRGTVIGAREVAMLAVLGLGRARVWRSRRSR